MKSLAYVRSLAAKFFHRSEVAQDMDEELRSHIQHRADDLQRPGISRAEAERRARLTAISSRQRFRMCASAFVCCANHPDSRPPRF
jgi:hypothetical protein